MASILDETRSWLEARYREAGLPAPGLRRVARSDFAVPAAPGAGALLVEDRELRLFLVLLELDGEQGPEALAGQLEQDLQAAWVLRSACLPKPGPGAPGAAAAWRVALHWLGREAAESTWRNAILCARQNGRVLEEIPVNACFRAAMETIGGCLDRNGLPSLLLTARAVFAKDARATALWRSADQRVREGLDGLEETFAQPRARAIAQELRALAGAAAAPELPAGPPSRLAALAVQDLRGVRQLRLEPWPDGRAVQAWVLSGPNGSGKSSLAEAVSLKAFGTSRGLCGFLRDGDVSRARTPDNYVGQYLAPLAGGSPRCGFDGVPGPLVLAPDLPAALAALAEADGSIAAQGGPAGFLDTPGDELGVRMAQSLSSLANRLEAHLEAGRQQAAEGRTALARHHGIGAGTKLLASFQDKIARAQLSAARTTPARVLGDLLACQALLPGAEGASARTLLAAWEAPEDPDTQVRAALRNLAGGPAAVAAALLPFFTAREDRAAALAAHLERFRAALGALPFAPAGLAQEASRWAAWLATPAAAAPAPAPAPAAGELEQLLAERQAVAAAGKRAKPRQGHLEAALQFIREHWRDQHPQDCPTCGSSLPAPAEATVAALLAAAERELAAGRERYAALTADIRQLETRPEAVAAGGCPVSPERRRQLQALTAQLLGTEADAAQLLAAAGSREALLDLLRWAEAPPAAPAPAEPAAAAAAACAAGITGACLEAERALAEPEAWELVAKELGRRLAAVVGEHLPATLEALWRELAGNLSAAPWLLPAPVQFRPRIHRGANRVEMVLGGPAGEQRLARHLLNDGQRNVLGLAWGFCQHLLKGRFRHAWLVLDDPGQDLDQPTFRALVRFLVSLLNLYEAAGQPFTLMLLLAQEDRALEAARETGQGLIRLGWTGRQEDATLQRAGSFDAAARCPQPEDLFGAAAG